MNLKEAAKQGISRVTKQEWTPETYIRIDLVEGGHGPWARLYDRHIQEACGFETPQSMLTWNFEDDDFIEYKGTIDKDDL